MVPVAVAELPPTGHGAPAWLGGPGETQPGWAGALHPACDTHTSWGEHDGASGALRQAEGGGSSPSLAPRPQSAPHQGVHASAASPSSSLSPHVATSPPPHRCAEVPVKETEQKRSIPGVEPSLALMGSRTLGRPAGAEPKSVPLLRAAFTAGLSFPFAGAVPIPLPAAE